MSWKNGDSILAVGLLDMSSFAKFIIKGETKSVVNYLQTLCSNDVDIPVGGIIPTGMLNENGDSSFSIDSNRSVVPNLGYVRNLKM